MVFECYKTLLFSYMFCPVCNVQISSDFFAFVANSVDCVSAGFLAGRCDAVNDQLVVRGFVHFIEVGCFVSSFTFGTIDSKTVFFSHLIVIRTALPCFL